MTSPATQATASQHSASQIMAHYANGLRAFTFWVSDTLYAIDISKVLTISRELGNMLTEREKDHIEWVQALEDSLLNDTPFVKAKDPHKCAFGQWYDTFKSRDETLMEALSEFDKPHTQIHSLADIQLFVFADFGAMVGQPIPEGLPNVAAWFKRIAERPSAAASVHPSQAA